RDPDADARGLDQGLDHGAPGFSARSSMNDPAATSHRPRGAPPQRGRLRVMITPSRVRLCPSAEAYVPDRKDIARRSFILGIAAAAAATSSKASALVPAVRGAVTADAGSTQLAGLGAVEAVARMARGELSAERYAGALLARCAALRALNAFITLE